MRYLDSGTRDPTHALGFWLEENVFRDASVQELRWQTGFFDAGSLGYFIPTMARLRPSDGTLSVLVGSNDGMTRREDVEALIDAAGPPRRNQQIGVVKFRTGYFHPKTIHIVRQDGSSAAYVGSANLTRNGVTSLHVEAGLLLDTRERDDASVLQEISQAIDAWFAPPRDGLNVVSNPHQLQKLVENGILGVPIPATPPLQGAAKITNIFARKLTPLVSVPTPPPIPVRTPTPAPTATTPPATTGELPPSISVLEDSWWKKLTRSDAQRKSQGNQRGSIAAVATDRRAQAVVDVCVEHEPNSKEDSRLFQGTRGMDAKWMLMAMRRNSAKSAWRVRMISLRPPIPMAIGCSLSPLGRKRATTPAPGVTRSADTA
jgi:hypothetical protein